MIEIKKGFFDRIDQTFKLLKNGYQVIIPFVLFNVIMISLIPNIAFLLGSSIIDFNTISTDKYVIYGIIIAILFISYFLMYLIFSIIFYLSLIFLTNRLLTGEKIVLKEGINYGLKNILNSFKAYWYVFSYSYLLPSMVFILGGLVFIFGFEQSILEVRNMGVGLIILSLVLIITYSIYRGIKAKFAIISAVDKNSFDKNNFVDSVSVSKGKWWRVFGNIFLIGLIIGAVTSIINGVINSVFFVSGGGVNQFVEIISNINEISAEELESLDLSIESNLISSVMNIISGLITNTITFSLSGFGIVFLYLFFKRLEIERELEITSKNELGSL